MWGMESKEQERGRRIGVRWTTQWGLVLSHDASPPSLKFLVSAASLGGAAERRIQAGWRDIVSWGTGRESGEPVHKWWGGGTRDVATCARLRSHWTPEIDNDVIWVLWGLKCLREFCEITVPSNKVLGPTVNGVSTFLLSPTRGPPLVHSLCNTCLQSGPRDLFGCLREWKSSSQ